MNEPVIDDEIRLDPADALRILIESEGFAMMRAFVREHFGLAAVDLKIDQILNVHPQSEHSVMIQAVRGTAKAVREAMNWPEEEFDRLRNAPGKPKVDRFAQFRRV